MQAQTDVVAIACPYGKIADPLAPIQLTGFNVERQDKSNMIIWAAKGAQIKGFRLYRIEGDNELLVADGEASPDRLMRVEDQHGGKEARYTIELIDAMGWVTRVDSSGETERLTKQMAMTRQTELRRGLSVAIR
ncbi:MAG: hypothetical protein ACR2RF_05690 [Geminicoccaceae bacterium]